MERNAYLDVARRLRQHVRDGTTDMADAPYKVAVQEYRDPELWKREVELFRTVPLLLGLSSELALPGDYKAVEPVGTPVILVRGKDHKVRAFLNICRHRGTHLVDPGPGRCSRFVCPFHAWTYDLAGALVGVTDREKFGPISTAEYSLIELFCEERAGLIFACLTPGSSFDLGNFLGGMLAELDAFDLGQWSVRHKHSMKGANWKLAWDTYLEFYHIAFVHAQSAGGSIVNNTMAIDFFGGDTFGPHQRIAAPTRDILKDLDKPEGEWATEEGLRTTVRYVFPNVSIAIDGNGGMLSTIYPGTAVGDSITTQYQIFPTAMSSDENLARFKEQAEFYRKVVGEEDYPTTFKVQNSLRSPGNEHFIFGRNELGLQAFHRALDHWMRRQDSGLGRPGAAIIKHVADKASGPR